MTFVHMTLDFTSEGSRQYLMSVYIFTKYIETYLSI